jgi:RNA polymerase sigma factor (sigma-70 family)
MMTTSTMSAFAQDDAQLVIASLSGDRDAFGRIVSRYQSLICSMAYSATGRLGESEDLAQETFLTAWKHLRELRERHKLRAWLCGIARNRINNALRREGREPLHHADALESAHESASPEPLPRDQTISNEEAAILWRSLEQIPELYREVLVLFYREHQSIENVAAALDLSEDAVKQRLSRGRKLLQEQVLAFVEGALEKTIPGKAFTLAVLASLPLLATSAKAATLGAVAIKGGAAAKGAAALGIFNAILSPVLGLVGPWLQYRVVLKAAQTDHERHTIKRYYRRLFGLILGFGVLLAALTIFSGRLIRSHPLVFVCALIALVAAYVGAAIRMGVWANGMLRKLRQESDALGATSPAKPAWEYRSRLELLGLPLVHFRFNRSAAAQRTPVKAWIAAGDFAFGVLFAFGGLAIAPMSIGGIAIGLMPWGGLAAGLFAIGGFAVGGWAFGGFALGWQAFGGLALAINAAMGGMAIARDVALGGVAHAAQANNEIASQFINGNFFFQRMIALSHYIGWLNLLWLIPVFGWRRIWTKRPDHNRVQDGE